ncbi:MAG: BlaI/MecI/CopY family transcriptional regulator [Planctomycetes bacterium]|nr:BlaI/MecI/CopY family transcriptional regulator [Planctomycetota bacterium]
MERKSLHELGAQQRAVMQIVWQTGEATVQQVRRRLTRDKPLAYTTVLSVMQKLEKGGWLTHRTEGRSYVYTARRTRREAGASSLRKFIDRVLGGDTLPLFQHLVEDEALDEKDLAAIRRILQKKRKEHPDAD